MRIAILGNSGSGKSTLARRLADDPGIEILDLDTVAWEPGRIAVPRDPLTALDDVAAFCCAHPRWVVEGCYASLIGATLSYRPRLVFLDPGVDVCIAHCKARPFEPHKYRSKAEQDRMLEPLLAWVAAYDTRDGEMSHTAHVALFGAYDGPKERVASVR